MTGPNDNTSTHAKDMLSDLYRLIEALDDVRRRLVEQHGDIDQKVAIELGWIERRPKAGDDPVALQPLEALGRCRRRQADFQRQVGQRHSPVFLQRPENGPVGAIELLHISPKY